MKKNQVSKNSTECNKNGKLSLSQKLIFALEIVLFFVISAIFLEKSYQYYQTSALVLAFITLLGGCVLGFLFISVFLRFVTLKVTVFQGTIQWKNYIPRRYYCMVKEKPGIFLLLPNKRNFNEIQVGHTYYFYVLYPAIHEKLFKIQTILSLEQKSAIQNYQNASKSVLSGFNIKEPEPRSSTDLSKKENPNTFLQLAWSKNSPTLVTCSTKYGAYFFFGDWAGNLWAVKSDTGEKVWSNKIKKAPIRYIFIDKNLVWSVDIFGTIRAFNAESGAFIKEIKLKYGGSGFQYFGGYLFFYEKMKRVYETAGIPCRLNLFTEEKFFYTDRNNTLGRSKYVIHKDIAVIPEENAVVFFIAPNLVKYSIDTGKILHQWHLPNVAFINGLTSFGKNLVLITHPVHKKVSGMSLKEYKKLNPFPLLFLSETMRIEYAVDASAELSNYSNAVKMSEGTFLVYCAQCIFIIKDNEIAYSKPLPIYKVYNNEPGGVFFINKKYLVFQADNIKAENFILHIFEFDPVNWKLERFCDPVITHPWGSHSERPIVEQHGEKLIILGEKRYHCLQTNNHP